MKWGLLILSLGFFLLWQHERELRLTAVRLMEITEEDFVECEAKPHVCPKLTCPECTPCVVEIKPADQVYVTDSCDPCKCGVDDYE